MITYEQMTMDAASTANYMSLFKTVFGAGKMTEGLFNWKYLSNPAGESIIIVATQSDKFIGARSLWATRLVIDGIPRLCYQPCDTMVHPDFRRQGVFTALNMHALASARERGCYMLYNFPNEYSYRGCIKLGWVLAAPMERLIVPLSVRLAYEYARRIAGFRTVRIPIPVPAISQPFKAPNRLVIRTTGVEECVQVFNNIARKMSSYILPDRTKSSFHWRYLERPGKNYWLVAFEHRDVVVGYAVLDMTAGGYSSCYIVELIVVPSAAYKALFALRSYVRDLGIDLMWTSTLRDQMEMTLLQRARLGVLTTKGLPGLVMKPISEQGIDVEHTRWWVWPGMTDTA